MPITDSVASVAAGILPLRTRTGARPTGFGKSSPTRPATEPGAASKRIDWSSFPLLARQPGGTETEKR
ncbi:hypothetical protein [Mesorhizobium sp. M4A.F.Ca.ET.090.04.2.1]|uniref:hypothetical protein n=1 Tax=Mesorhizobium sp. M4A.F.Ca.ET.090.04.2.1 TaxID=2496663 RepID=UPI001FDF9FFB|nr:hypothetical protein [Mesorhizobium sp. M4A.F.Ca.ET.090.04.2.1]